MKKILLTFCLIALFFLPVRAAEMHCTHAAVILLSPTVSPIPSEHIYNDEGHFVKVPGRIVSINLITIAGMPLTVPLCSLYEPFGINDGDLNLSLMDGYRLSANILYTIGGLPFYIVKKLFWDGPVYLYEAVEGKGTEHD